MQYAYLVGVGIFSVIWFILFWFRKDLRREILSLSIIGGLLFPLALIFLPDYWNPEHIFSNLLGIEDFLFAFTIAGIGAVLYEIIFKKIHTLCECRKKDPRSLLIIAIIAIFIFASLTFVFGVNSIYANYAAFLSIFFYFIYFRRDLFWQAIFSGVLVSILMFIFYQIWTRIYPGIIDKWWQLQNISGILIFGVPLEELMWGFTWGLVGGIAYEFMRGINISDGKKK